MKNASCSLESSNIYDCIEDTDHDSFAGRIQKEFGYDKELITDIQELFMNFVPINYNHLNDQK